MNKEIEKIIKEWNIAMIAQSLSPTTCKERLRLVKAFAQYNNDVLINASIEDITQWLARAPSAITRWCYYTNLKAFYRWCVLTDRLLSNPMDRIPSPKKPTYKARPVPQEHIQIVLEGRLRDKTRLMILLAYLHGLRIHEIAKIRGKDYDANTGILEVIGKGNQEAAVFFPPVLQNLVRKMSLPVSDFWFPSPVRKGDHIRPNSVGFTIEQAFKRHGFKMTAHQLRHSTGTELVRAGVNIRVVQEVLRHKSLQSTQIYTQVSDDQVRAAVLKIPLFEDLQDKEKTDER